MKGSLRFVAAAYAFQRDCESVVKYRQLGIDTDGRLEVTCCCSPVRQLEVYRAWVASVT
jgi:hypothetical protein